MHQSAPIIIVDDDEDILKMLAFAFEEKGFSTKTFTLGKDAESYITTHPSPRLLVLDRLLPDMDGIQIIRHLQHNGPVQFPILVLSMLSAEKDVLQGLQIGAVDYVTKPFSLPVFIQKATMLLGKK